MFIEKKNLAHSMTAEDFYNEVKLRLGQIGTEEDCITLITLDFDNFNYVNDLFGYQVGDITLEKITEHFDEQLQENDVFCRLHADHFLFCLKNVDQQVGAQIFLQLTDLNAALSGVLPAHYSLVASGGILIVNDNIMPLSALLDRANYARKKSKGNTVNTFHFYDEKMSKEVQWQKQITLIMESALLNGEFQMYLQPKLLIKTGEIVGAEALARWSSPEHGLIYPDQFISIMEQNGFIRQLDFFILEEACRFLKKSKERGIPQLPVSVNFSKAHLHTQNLADKIFHTVNCQGISPHLIEIEFTENLFSDNVDRLIAIVGDLKSLGFRVSMDDFGSAYSSLNYLKDIPVDIVKIDKEFLNSSANTDRGKVIIAKVIDLIKSLKMLSVVEGVENQEQVEFLQSLNCDFGQGYFYAKPMPVEDYISYIEKGLVFEDIREHFHNVKQQELCGAAEELEKTAMLQKSLEDKITELEGVVKSEQGFKEALRVSEERYRVVVEQSDDIMFEWDFDSDVVNFSSKYEAVFGCAPLTADVSTNEKIRQLIHPDDRMIFEEWIENTYRKPGCTVYQYRIKDISGNYLWMNCRSTAICNHKGVPVKVIGLFTNIDEHKQQMDQLRLKAELDPLTKLLNKEESQEQVDRMLKSSDYDAGVFFMIDIDNFKSLNDNLGHQLGDKVLKDIADNVRDVFPETDLIGRIGGDEFIVYLPCDDGSIIRSKAELLSQALRLSYYGAVSKYEISGSIGIACYPQHGESFSELFRFADIALYASKNKGKDRYTIYDDNIESALADNRTPVEYSENFLNTYFHNDITFHVFEMLYETKDVPASIQMILEMLGQKYSMDRVYVFQYDEKGRHMSNTYEWCVEGISSEMEHLQNLSLEELAPYFDEYSDEGVFCCENIEETIPEVQDICAPQGIKSLLHCAIYNEGVMNGVIGFDACQNYHSWTGEEIAVLGYISRILSVFLTKNTTSMKLRTSYENYAEMLENLNGHVYVVDPFTYEVLYVNRAIQELGLAGGQPCYQMAFKSERPCKNCPIFKLSDTQYYATAEIYSDALDCWVNSAASKMKWEGDREAVLICCTDISKYKL